MVASIKEAFAPIAPIAVLVIILEWITGFMQAGSMYYWLAGTLFAGTGLFFFLRGVTLCLIPMAELIGKRFLYMRGMTMLCIVVFLIGFLACMADPCVAVLNGEVAKISGNTLSSITRGGTAAQGSSPPTWLVMGLVMSGIGLLLLAGILRIVKNISPAKMIGSIVGLILVLSVISSLAGVKSFVPLALDSGGVATGPLTVPFFLAIGLGFVSNIAGRSASSDGFGLLGIVALGPVIGVLLLGLVWGAEDIKPTAEEIDGRRESAASFSPSPSMENAGGGSFPSGNKETTPAHPNEGNAQAEMLNPLPETALPQTAPPQTEASQTETPQAAKTFTAMLIDFADIRGTTLGVLRGLVPLMLIGWFIGVLPSKVSPEYKIRLLKGAVWVLIGLILFLQAVTVGFQPIAQQLGIALAEIWHGKALIPAGLLLGLAVGLAEPSIHVLCNQVEDVTDGTIPKRLLLLLLAGGVSLAVALGMTRLVFGISILWIVVPCYLIILLLSYFCTKTFASIAYDASTVVTGPVLVTFLMILASSAAETLGRDPLLDGFGFVATVAMVPILVVMATGAMSEFMKR